MPKNFDKLVEKVINQSDILLIVLDARRVKDSINKKIELKIKKQKKKLIYVINKIDLIKKYQQDKIILKNSFQISAKKHIGSLTLLKKIMEVGKGKEVTVGVVGYPNTGKSTIINALKGRKSAKTSSISGYTKALQRIRISKKVLMIDTPGVFSYEPKEEISNIIIGAVDNQKVKDPEDTAIQLIEKLKGKVEKYYKVKKHEDALETLEIIAMKKNILKKGNKPDTARMGKEIIRLWQIGKIK